MVRFLKNHRQKKQRHQQIMSKNQTVAKHEHSLSKWNVKCFFKNCVYMFTQVTDKNIWTKVWVSFYTFFTPF